MRRIALVAALVAVAGALAPGASATPWATRSAFTVAGSPVAVASADLDGDGVLDLVTASRIGDTVSVLLGVGDGLFGSRADLATGSSPADVVVDDFDGDGRPDLGVAVLGGVDVFAGLGDGTFEPALRVTTGDSGAYGTADTADFDGDGNVDLAVGNGGGVSLLLGRGDGGFKAAVVYATGLGMNVVAAGDYDGDGHADVAVANRGAGTITVLLGEGDGALASAGEDTVLGDTLADVAAGDLDCDGADDLVTAAGAPGHVGVLLSTGDGGFAAPVHYPSGDLPCSVTVGDLNGDDRPDVISTATALYAMTSGLVCVRLGDGEGGLGARVDWATALDARSVVAADVTGDGRLDVCAACAQSGVATVLQGTGAGGFLHEEVVPTADRAVPLAAGDLNGDGEPDLLTREDEALGILLGRGGGAFEVATSVPTAWGARSLVVADFDGDGDADIAEAQTDQDVVRVRLGHGDATFGAPEDHRVAGAPTGVVAADFDGDGHPDLAVAAYHDVSISVLLGHGDGTFADGVKYAADQSGGFPDDVAAGDFDHDGAVDLAVSRDRSWMASDVMVYLGDGDGSFQPKVSYPVGPHANGVTVADFDQDGFSDLFVGGTPASSLLLGKGDGTFEAGCDAPASASGAAAADVDRDGDPDLVLWGGGGVALGNGDGTFEASFAIGSLRAPGSLVLGAFGGLGKTDIVTANAWPDTGVRLTRDLGPPGAMSLAGDAWCGSSPVVAVESRVPDAAQMRVRWWRGHAQATVEAWQPYQPQAGVVLQGGDGPYTVCVDYRLAGTRVLTLARQVFLDTAAPSVKLDGVKDGAWYRAPVLGKVVGSDGGMGSGIASVAVQIDGVVSTAHGDVAWVPIAAPADHSNDGRHTMIFRAVDSVGLQSQALQAVVGIDTLGPTTKARGVRGRAGRSLTLYGLVSDLTSPKATVVRITVSDARGRKVKTLACGTRSVGTWFTARWTPARRGKYTYKVTALDLAGNRQTRASRGTVDVR